jgi:hypothetical protein
MEKILMNTLGDKLSKREGEQSKDQIQNILINYITI